MVQQKTTRQLPAELHHRRIGQEDQAVQACTEPFILPREQIKDHHFKWEEKHHNDKLIYIIILYSIKSLKESLTKYSYVILKTL